jgi:hypothetical protein
VRSAIQIDNKPRIDNSSLRICDNDSATGSAGAC